MVQLSGNPKGPLSNVIVCVKLQNETEDRAVAYLFLPALKPQQYVQVDVPSEFAPLARTSRKVAATFSLICDQGAMLDRPVNLGTPTRPPAQTSTRRQRASSTSIANKLPIFCAKCRSFIPWVMPNWRQSTFFPP